MSLLDNIPSQEESEVTHSVGAPSYPQGGVKPQKLTPVKRGVGVSDDKGLEP
jgi:hypothetical protein